MDELALIGVLLAAIASVSCLAVEDKRLIRLMPRAAWMLGIIVLPLVGPAAWFLAGRPRTLRISRRTHGYIRPGSGTSPTTLAPDDDTEFLRSLDQPPPDSGTGAPIPPRP